MVPRVEDSLALFLAGFDRPDCVLILRTIGDFWARSYSDISVELCWGAAGHGDGDLPLLLGGGGGEEGSLALATGDTGGGVGGGGGEDGSLSLAWGVTGGGVGGTTVGGSDAPVVAFLGWALVSLKTMRPSGLDGLAIIYSQTQKIVWFTYFTHYSKYFGYEVILCRMFIHTPSSPHHHHTKKYNKTKL